ncbi:MAG: hypothetical protein V4787_19610 [Pseudomonadota bacterium]
MNAPVRNLPLTDDDLRLVAQIGFIALESAQVLHAQVIFDALRVIKPEKSLPWIGLSQVQLGLGRAQEAVRMLRKALVEHPADGDLLAYLGLALREAGHERESNAVLQSACDAGQPTDPHVAMARALLTRPPAGGVSTAPRRKAQPALAATYPKIPPPRLRRESRHAR